MSSPSRSLAPWLATGVLVALLAGLAVWWLRSGVPESAHAPALAEAQPAAADALQPVHIAAGDARALQDTSAETDAVAADVPAASRDEGPHLDVVVRDVDLLPIEGARVEITGDA